MPIYEYRCESCGHTLDALQKIADAPLTDCPSCDDIALKRLVSAPAFRLKGKGWYETDFKSDKETKRNLADGADGEAKPDKDKSADGKPDAKPDRKADGKSTAGGKPESGGRDSAAAGKSDGDSGRASRASTPRQSGTEAA